MYWYCPFHFLWSMLDSCYMSMFILSLLPISVTIMGKYSHLIDIRLCFISFYIDWLRRETPKDAKKVYFAIELDLLSYKISKYIFLIFDWNKLSRQTKSVLSTFHIPFLRIKSPSKLNFRTNQYFVDNSSSVANFPIEFWHFHSERISPRIIWKESKFFVKLIWHQ